LARPLSATGPCSVWAGFGCPPQRHQPPCQQSWGRVNVVTQSTPEMFNPEFLTTDNEAISSNSLIQYLQEQSPDVLQRVARSASGDIQDIIRHNVQGLLGMLPGEQFEVKIQTNREHLGGLLASAMMTGYFLRQMEQRMELEVSLLGNGELDHQLDSDPGELNL